MFVYSIKSKNLLIRLAIAGAVVLVIILILIFLPGKVQTTSANEDYEVSDTIKGSVTDYLTGLGYTLDSNVQECVVTIPTQWNDTYKNYNEMQVSQGYDLSFYKGVDVTRLTYNITNYIGEEETPEQVLANVYIYRGEIIGGDVCSAELDGFMTTFEEGAKHLSTNQGTQAG